MSDSTCCAPEISHPTVVIGAGPVGLAAAAHLLRRGRPVRVLEAGPEAGAAVREWGHVRLFSPWGLCLDDAAVALLEGAGWKAPDPELHPTGDDLVDRYLRPLAEHPALRTRIRYGHRVTGVTREGRDRLKGVDRNETPFLVRFRGPGGEPGELRAPAVIDASGTWSRPRPLGAHGLPADGEPDAGDRIAYGIPDVAGTERDDYVGRRVAVVGAGHSAANVLLELDRLRESAPETRPTWILRGGSPELAYGGEEDDELGARGALGRRLRELVESGRVDVRTGFRIGRVERGDGGVRLVADDGRHVEADRVVTVTGFRPDLEMLRELRLDLDPVTEAPRSLGPLIDPNVHSCGTVPPHGEAELRHPEPGFYMVGMKSFGRAPTFLLKTGYEQVRSVAAALDGDEEAARRVELELPETGVCSVDAVLEDGSAAPEVCCA